MKQLRSYWNDNKTLLICLAIAMLLIFGTYILGMERFVLGYDYQYQHLYFYQDFHRLISSGQFPLWSNNLFLGVNFWASKSYYILGDPFAYITLLFSRENLLTALFFTYILKFITAALLFNHLLFKMGIKKEIRFIPVLMYTFCGWATMFAEHPMFLVWHTFLPLILIGIENVLKNRKYTTFILATFLIFISNYYFFWTTSVFLTFYWTIRYYQTKEFKLKTYLMDTLKLIGTYFIGVLMAMFLILPSILHLTQNVRVSEAIEITKKWNPIKIYLDMIVKSLIAPFQVSELGHMLFNTTDYATNQLSLYSSVLTILLLPQMFTVLKGKLKKGFIILFLILGVLLVTPYGASLLHGFKEPTFRWTLLLITCMILVVAFILNDADGINKKWLLFSLGFIIFVIFGLRFLARKQYGIIWDHLKPEYNGLLLAAGFAILYCLFIINKHKQWIKVLFCLLFVSELSYGAYSSFHRYPEFENFDYENIISKEAISYIKEQEDSLSFYRVFVPYAHTKAAMPHNINLYYDYMGAYTYDSLYQFTLGSFIEKDLGISPGTWQITIQNFDILKKLNFKYFMVKSSEFNLGKPDIHKETANLKDYPEFKLINEVDGYLIYEVTDYVPFALDLTTLSDNYIAGTVNSSNDGVVTLTIAYDKGWIVKVNGKEAVCTSADGGFISFQANLNDEVELSFIPYGLKLGLILTGVGFILFAYFVYKEKKG